MEKVQEVLKKSLDESVSPIISDVTEAKLNLSRSFSFAGAGFSVAAIIAFTTLPSLSTTLEIALVMFSISIPLHLIMGFITENFIWAGKSSFKSYVDLMYNWKILTSVFGAYLSTAAGVILVIFNLSFTAGVLLLLTSFLVIRINNHVQRCLVEVLNSKE